MVGCEPRELLIDGAPELPELVSVGRRRVGRRIEHEVPDQDTRLEGSLFDREEALLRSLVGVLDAADLVEHRRGLPERGDAWQENEQEQCPEAYKEDGPGSVSQRSLLLRLSHLRSQCSSQFPGNFPRRLDVPPQLRSSYWLGAGCGRL